MALIGDLVGRLRTSPRARYAILGNGAVSIAGLALSVATARSTSVPEFGGFAMAMIVFALVSGTARAAFTDTALARPDESDARLRSFRRASLTALLAGAGLLAWGLLSGSVYLTVLGVTLHGLLALDFVRTFESAAGDARGALGCGLGWAGATVAACLPSFVQPGGGLVPFLGWAAAGAVAGYAAMLRTRLPWRPGWPAQRDETVVAAQFAADHAVGSGGSALTTVLVGVAVDSSVVGALRGAGTLLGPVNLIASTARSLTIPLLARAGSDLQRGRIAARVALLLTIAIAPLLALVQFLPDAWGNWLLGSTWPLAASALLPLAVEALFALVGGVASAGHRAAFAGRRALLLRLCVGVPRPFLVLTAALLWGIPGAAWAMAGIAALNSVLWWFSYRELLRNPAAGTPTD